MLVVDNIFNYRPNDCLDPFSRERDGSFEFDAIVTNLKEIW